MALNEKKFIEKNINSLKTNDTAFETVSYKDSIIIEKGSRISDEIKEKLQKTGISKIKVNKIPIISRPVNINLIRPGMMVTGPVYDEIGSKIYSDEVVKKITAEELKIIRKRGVKEINLIRNSESEAIFQTLHRTDKKKHDLRKKKLEQDNIDVSDIQGEEIFEKDSIRRKSILEETLKLEQKIKEQIENGSTDDDRISTVEQILKQHEKDSDAVLLLNWLRDTDYATNFLAHAKSIADYSIMVGKIMDMGIKELTELAYSAFVCDFGMIDISNKILSEKIISRKIVMHELRKHPFISAERAEKLDLPVKTVQAVRQHHERPDGSGYPLGLKDDDISVYAAIITVVDSYDAMISKRSYKSTTKMATAAIKELIEESNHGKFNKEIVNCFFRILSLYPVSTIVELTNGFIGIVTKINEKISFRPSVTLFMDNKQKLMEYPKVVDLSINKSTIKKEIKLNDISMSRDDLKNILIEKSD